MDAVVSSLIKRIHSLPKPTLIGVSGFGGSGKSTFASALGGHLSAPVICVDAFFLSTVQKDYECWDVIDRARLIREVLKPFTAGSEQITYRPLDWETNTLGKEISIEHDGTLIVEGVGLFTPEVMEYLSFIIWIDCPIETAIERGKKRDREEYQYPQDELWDGIWKENDLQFFEKHSPKAMADVVVDHNTVGELFIL